MQNETILICDLNKLNSSRSASSFIFDFPCILLPSAQQHNSAFGSSVLPVCPVGAVTFECRDLDT